MTPDPAGDALAGGEPPAEPYDLRCSWCPHPWHGVHCEEDCACKCESSLTCRDDSWRPRLTQSNADRAAIVMHDTGCDGWVAKLASAYAVIPGIPAPQRIKSHLYDTLNRARDAV